MSGKELTRNWFVYAARDMQAAKVLFETMWPRPYEIICYHCQQAAEKALKGFLIHHNTEPPKSHNLSVLCQMCSAFDESFQGFQEVCSKLTAYGAATRYPDGGDIEEHHAGFSLREAERVYAFCAGLVPGL
jgi:HEPN domain-containing protein